MKRLLFGLIVSCLLIDCTRSEEPLSSLSDVTDGMTFYSSFEPSFNDDTKVYIDTKHKMHWNSSDFITVFADGKRSKYEFEGKTGDTGGTFSHISSEDSVITTTLSRNYAIFPYVGGASISASGEMSAYIPEIQSYQKDSFDEKSNIMVAETQDTDDRNLIFKNACGYVEVSVNGSGTVKKITLKGNNGEKISGAAKVSFSESIPVITMDAKAGEEIVLDCGSGICVDTCLASFLLVVPPTVFEKGFTVTVTDINDNEFVRVSEKVHTVSRNIIMQMPSFKIGPISSLVNTYCSSSSTVKIGDKYWSGSVFNWTIVNNSFDDIQIKRMYIFDWVNQNIEAEYEITDASLATWTSATYQFKVDWYMDIRQPVCVFLFEHGGIEYYSVGAYDSAVDPFVPQGIELKKKQLVLLSGESAQIEATAKPFYITDIVFTYSSTDESVVTVSAVGELEGKGEGNGLVIATLGEHADTCSVYVLSSLPEGTVNFGGSVLWGTCNLGASVPTEYGELYAWGETTPWVSMDAYSFEYTSMENLPLENDAAAVTLGGHWRMPTYSEMVEMLESVSATKETVGEIVVNKMSIPNGDYILLPWAGTGVYGRYAVGEQYWYMTSTPSSSSNSYYYSNYYSNSNGMRSWPRSCGVSIRPVWDPALNR